MEIRKVKPVSASRTTMTELVMPNETNPLGNLMGGNLMKWMDIAGAICAGRHAECHVVTASVDNVSFQNPVRLGEIITLEARVTRAFTTSVEVFIEVFVNDVINGENKKSNQAYLTFVALDPSTLKPRIVPELLPETDVEKELFAGANRRREIRLVLAGRMKPSEAKEVTSFLVHHSKEGN